MANDRATSHQVAVLIVNLALIIACLVILGAGLLVYRWLAGASMAKQSEGILPLRPSFSPMVAAIEAQTATMTRTPHPSLTPTITLTPSRTPTPTATPLPTDLPTLTPARPLPQSSVYRLKLWEPQDADYLVRLMHAYTNTLLAATQENQPAAHANAYKFAIFALREALLRFPQAPQAESWRWALAHDLARSGERQQAAEQYVRLIVDALNREETAISFLYTWFAQHESGLSLYMTSIEPPPGYLNAYLINLHGELGDAFLWLLEGPSGFRGYPLTALFDPGGKRQANWLLADFDGEANNGKEIAISFFPGEKEYVLHPPLVFNLREYPPKPLPFLPTPDLLRIGVEFEPYWAVETGNPAMLRFETRVLPACPIQVKQLYRWNGQYFALDREEYALKPSEKALPFCAISVEHALNTWGPAAAIPLMEALLPYWPPPKDAQGNQFSAEAKEEWRYRLGVYYALIGEEERAIAYLSQVSTEAAPTSRWVTLAQKFLRQYQRKEDVYRACLVAEGCNPAFAIRYLVGQVLPSQDALAALREAGVQPNASGYYDFDGDGESERWFTVRYFPRQASDFWILVNHRRGVEALRVGAVANVPPKVQPVEEAYLAEESLPVRAAVWVDSTYVVTLRRLPDTQRPYLVWLALRKELPSRFFGPLRENQDSLLAGKSPHEIQKALLALQEFPGLLCRATWSCDLYYYLLGLASELAGDEQKAVEAYHRLWSDYSKSPYTAMARLKLTSLVAPPTPSPTATVTSTLELTGTPATPTPTVSGTPPMATSSPSPTNTEEVYPYPYP